MLTLIIGDSQAQGAGNVLASRLRSAGQTVHVFAKPGASSAGVLAIAQEAADQYSNPDMVVVFSGSTAAGAPAAAGIPALFPAAMMYWYGSAPATQIGSVAYAQSVFGDKVTDVNYWFTCGEAADREKRNIELKVKLPTSVRYVDWRNLVFPDAQVQPSGVSFPNLTDGIHITGQHAKDAFSLANWPPSEPKSAWGGVALVGLGLLAFAAWRHWRQPRRPS